MRGYLISIRFDTDTGDYRYVSVVYAGTRAIFASGDVVADFNEAVEEFLGNVYFSEWTKAFLEANDGVYEVYYDSKGFPTLRRQLTPAA